MDSTFSRSVRDYIEIFQSVYKPMKWPGFYPHRSVCSRGLLTDYMQVSPANMPVLVPGILGAPCFIQTLEVRGMLGTGRNVVALLVLYLDIDTSPSTETLNSLLEMK